MQFSIIIPTFNAADTLSVCLKSIVSQTHKDFEILLIDAVSEDETLKIAKDYSEQFHGLTIVSERDAGIYDAMNKGIRLARGEWLYFMGSDDRIINKNVLSEIAAHLQRNDDVVYGNSIWVPENRAEKGEWSLAQLLQLNINHQRIFYKKALFEKWGNFDIQYKIASDYEANIRFFCTPVISKKFVNINVAFYHSGGYSAQHTDLEFWRNWKSTLYKNFIPYVKPAAIYQRVSWYCWYLIRQKKYWQAAHLFRIIYFHSFSLSFLKHSVSQMVKSMRSNRR